MALGSKGHEEGKGGGKEKEAAFSHPYHLERFWGDSKGWGGSRKPHAVWENNENHMYVIISHDQLSCDFIKIMCLCGKIMKECISCIFHCFTWFCCLFSSSGQPGISQGGWRGGKGASFSISLFAECTEVKKKVFTYKWIKKIVLKWKKKSLYKWIKKIV